MTNADSPLIAEVTIGAPLPVVWNAFREPAELRRWFGWEHDEQGGLDAEIDFIFVQKAVADEAAGTIDCGVGVFHLEDHGDETSVRLTREPPEGHTDWAGIYDEINEGWTTFLQQLRFYLERHRGEARKTTLHDATWEDGDGDEWFRTEHQRGYVTADGALVVRTPERVIVSRYR
jgi:hypothetical protein